MKPNIVTKLIIAYAIAVTLTCLACIAFAAPDAGDNSPASDNQLVVAITAVLMALIGFIIRHFEKKNDIK